MQQSTWSSLFIPLFLCSAVSMHSQVAGQNKTIVINGRAEDATVMEFAGKTYVDLDTLARIANGSLSYRDSQIILTLPDHSGSGSAPNSPTTEQQATNSFSREFMKAGIEEINLLREWASPVANAIQNGYPITEDWVAGYHGKASTGLHLASASVSTTADQQGYELLVKEFQMVSEWSNNLVEARKSMNAAKYATSPDALHADPLSQKIINCGHFIASMVASGVFQNDGACE